MQFSLHLDPLVQDLQDISFALKKFIRFSKHIRDELKYNENCGDNKSIFDEENVEFALGKGYFELLRNINPKDKKERKNITVEDITTLLTELLLDGYFDECYETFTDVYRLQRELSHFADVSDSETKKKLNEKGNDVYKLHHIKLLTAPEKEQNNTQDTVSGILSEEKKYSQLFESIRDAFELDISEIYDREKLLGLLEACGIIGEKEKAYFKTISLHIDFAYYLMTLLEKNDIFWQEISIEDMQELKCCFYAFHLSCGEQYYTDREQIDDIVDFSEDIIQGILNQDTDTIGHELLNQMLQWIQASAPYKPMYMRVRHLEFDELMNIPKTFEKALNILGILVCDILPGNHEIFQEASEVFLVHTRSEKTHRAVKNICNQKMASAQ